MTDMKEFVKGALIGGAIAGIAGLLLAQKPGSMLMNDISDMYDTAQQKGNDFVEAMKEKGSCLTACAEDESDVHSSFLIGGALGAIIGGVAALLLAPSSGKKLRKVLGNQYDDFREQAESFISTLEKKGSSAVHEMNDWKDTLADLINKLTKVSSKRKNHYDSNIDQILNLAQIGINLYQQLQKGK